MCINFFSNPIVFPGNEKSDFYNQTLQMFPESTATTQK